MLSTAYADGATLWDFTFARRWLDNMRQASMGSKGEIDAPPGHQWASRTPFVFPFVNMVV